MERRRQRQIALAAIAAAALGFATYRIRTTIAPSQTAASRSAARGGQDLSAGRAPAPPGLDVDALKQDRPEPVDAERDPFRFKPKPPPPPPPAVRPPTAPVPTGPIEPPPPPRIPLKFIGTMQADGIGRRAILADGKGMTFSGREGDVIEGRYRILKIGVESVELAYLDGRGRQTIRLTGQ